MSNKLTPTDWKTLVKIFEADGFAFDRQKGDHRCYVKKGVLRPIVIPEYKEIGLDIIKSNMRTAKMSRDKYMKLLKKVK
jgi:predicted RNA binding protein YcfA (HicA-like mRNA interferase family)